MKTSLFFLGIFFLFAFQRDKPTKVIFFGDSITQAGVQEGGYIVMMQEMLEKQGKNADYELIGSGIGGNKIYDLYLRIEEDVLIKNPDIVVIFVGVNDVWHKASHGTGTDADKFERFYRATIKKLQAQGIKVICCTPAVIGERTDHSNQQDGDLNHYSTIIRQLTKEMNVQLLDLRADFLKYNLQNNPENKEKGILTTDRVHLNAIGNRFLAEKMLEAVSSK